MFIMVILFLKNMNKISQFHSPLKNQDSSFNKKAPYQIRTDDLCLTMELLYHWVKKGLKLNALFPTMSIMQVYVHILHR